MVRSIGQSCHGACCTKKYQPSGLPCLRQKPVNESSPRVDRSCKHKPHIGISVETRNHSIWGQLTRRALPLLAPVGPTSTAQGRRGQGGNRPCHRARRG